jgi:hypothetical protein
MDFSEPIKKEVRTKADYKCCRCHKVGVEVHHIVPTKDSGTNDIDNAAPLCPNCHADFGDNVEKRKIIREMRDAWYKRVEEMYQPQGAPTETLEELNKNLINFKKGLSDIEEFRTEFRTGVDKLVNYWALNLTPSGSNATNAITGIIDIIGSTTGPAPTYGIVYCSKCGTGVGIGNNFCPNCGNKMR